jgi:Helix-turn-helix domain
MQLNFSPKWFDKMVIQENEHEIGAGVPHVKSGVGDPRTEQEQIAFSTLIQLLRRERKLSIDALSKAARVSISEILGIEDNPHFEPKPRTIHQLATFFKLPVPILTTLAGLADGRREEYSEKRNPRCMNL